MNSISLIFTISVLICFYHKSSATESEKCECDIFQMSENSNEINLTKQSGEINNRTFYFSKTDEEEKILWWNVTASSWMLQMFKSFSAVVTILIEENNDCLNLPQLTEDWKILSNRSNNGEIRSRCLTDPNKCQVNGEFDAKPIIFSNASTKVE